VSLLVVPPVRSAVVITTEGGISAEVLKLPAVLKVDELGAVPGPLLSLVTSLLVVHNGSAVLHGQDHVVSGGIGLLEVEPHALVGLHGGRLWLLVVLSELLGWLSVAINDLNVEINVGVQRDGLAANGWPREGATVSVERWAVQGCLCSLSQLGDSEVPAGENLMGTKSEGLGKTAWFSSRVSNDSAILEGSNPVDSGPVAWLAKVALAALLHVNTDSAESIVGIRVLVTVTVLTPRTRVRSGLLSHRVG